MSKASPSKLAPYADQLEEWLEIERISLREAQQRLAAQGCAVDASWLGKWWKDHKARRLESELLALIARGARQCQVLEEALAKGVTPEVEQLIQLYRSLILNLCVRSEASSTEEATNLLRLAADLMKPVLGWAALEERRRHRELTEQKYRDQVALQKAALERELHAAQATGGISPETLQRVERELRLL